MAYSIERLRQAREQKDAPGGTLADISPDAPYDTDETIGYWNGERFVSWQQYVYEQVFARLPKGSNRKR